MTTAQITFENLQKATFVKRVNRFIAEVSLNCDDLDNQQEILTVHVPSTGRLDTVLTAGQTCYLKPSANPARKTAYSLFLAETPSTLDREQPTLVCVDAMIANRFTAHLLSLGLFPGIPNNTIRAEASFGKDRLDFVAYDDTICPPKLHLIEVKSVNMCIDGVASFPDAPTERGQKHLQSLIDKQSESMYQTHVIFIVQRNDARSFTACVDRDPKFASLLENAYKNGTAIHVCGTDVSTTAMTMTNWLPIHF